MWFKKDKEETDELTYFTESWMEAWKLSINNSDDYKKKGKTWNAPILLKVEPAPDPIKEAGAAGIYLNLSYGECLDLRYATAQDERACNIILEADSKTWINLMEKGKDPTLSILKNSVTLQKGSLIMLSTQRKAAEALLKTAPTQHDQQGVTVNAPTDEAVRDPSHSSFKTTSHGLNFDSFPMKLFQKAKIYGTWNPADIDLSIDQAQWTEFTDGEQQILVHLSALFMAGEEAVTLDLLPLIQAVAREGRIEEEIFLTSFLWEEAKHTEFFSMYVQQVMTGPKDFESFHKPMYKILFYDKLPRALHTLHDDTSARAQLRAAATYNMIVEGTLAETGYAAFSKMLRDNELLPGLLEGIEKLKQDESRHIAFGLYLINRLLDENPGLGEEMEDLLEDLLYDATNIIHEIFSQYEHVPFGLEKEWFLNHAIQQFQNRIQKLNL